MTFHSWWAGITLFLFLLDGAMILLPYPVTKVAVVAVIFSLLASAQLQGVPNWAQVLYTMHTPHRLSLQSAIMIIIIYLLFLTFKFIWKILLQPQPRPMVNKMRQRRNEIEKHAVDTWCYHERSQRILQTSRLSKILRELKFHSIVVNEKRANMQKKRHCSSIVFFVFFTLFLRFWSPSPTTVTTT